VSSQLLEASLRALLALPPASDLALAQPGKSDAVGGSEFPSVSSITMPLCPLLLPNLRAFAPSSPNPASWLSASLPGCSGRNHRICSISTLPLSLQTGGPRVPSVSHANQLINHDLHSSIKQPYKEGAVRVYSLCCPTRGPL
jgi:hypothetical protein